jgi:hypothetical protein
MQRSPRICLIPFLLIRAPTLPVVAEDNDDSGLVPLLLLRF